MYYSNRCAALFEQHEYERALADANAAMRLDPSMAKAKTRAGRCHLHLGDLRLAHMYFSDVNYQTGLADVDRCTRLVANAQDHLRLNNYSAALTLGHV